MARLKPTDHITRDHIITALQATAGVIVFAAQKLGISRKTLHQWIAEDAEFQEVLHEIREETLDLAEAKFLVLMREGDREALRFYLRCFGRKRGWIETTRIEGPNGQAAMVVIADAAASFDGKLLGLIAAADANRAPVEANGSGEGG